jgi:hypothetical protein
VVVALHPAIRAREFRPLLSPSDSGYGGFVVAALVKLDVVDLLQRLFTKPLNSNCTAEVHSKPVLSRNSWRRIVARFPMEMQA